MDKPSFDSIKVTTEKASTFLDWLVNWFRKKNWAYKLILIDVLLFVIFNPAVASLVFKFFGIELPAYYVLYFWLVVSLIGIVILIIAIRAKPEVLPISLDVTERSAVRGLRPFGFEDAEIFMRLQRKDMLKECLHAITERDFRFGILFGESGCGKTSFLKAGIWPMIIRQSESHYCVYVKFSDMDPFDTIKQALKEQTKLSENDFQESDFMNLLEKTAQNEGKIIILLLDQFEQFFVRHARVEQRQPFIEFMASWYKDHCTMPVKILICLRDDFMGRMFEFQKEMDYSLGLQETFRLDKFTPKQATRIFEVIAENANLTFDRNFVEEMTNLELAGKEDGLISPVDIQILAWVIRGQKSEQERGFNRKIYQKLGGIEGLLENFLTNALMTVVPESQRKVVLKVMLALIDLERNVRAGVLTHHQILDKLIGTVTANEIQAAVSWLEQKGRLVTSIKRDGSFGYELAHERLIPALRRLAGKKLSDADLVNQLLERRVNEWLGNECADRYLLTWREIKRINQEKPYIVWGSKRSQKENLLLKSRLRLRRRFAIALAPILLVTACIIAILLWWHSPQGQIYQINNELKRLSEKTKSSDELAEITHVFCNGGDFKKAHQFVSKINDESYKIYVLCDMAECAARMGARDEAEVFIKEAYKVIDIIDNDLSRAYFLSDIAETAALIYEVTKDTTFLNCACQIADTMPDDVEYLKTRIWRVVIQSTGELYKITRDTVFLMQARHIVDGIPDEYDGSGYWMNVIIAHVLEIFKITEDTTFLMQARQIANEILDEDYKSLCWKNIAKTIADMCETKKDTILFIQIKEIIENIPLEGVKADVLAGAALAAVNVGEKESAVAFLHRAHRIAEKISFADEYDKVSLLTMIAQSAAYIFGITKDTVFFSQACEIIDIIPEEIDRIDLLNDIACSMAKVGRVDTAMILLEHAHQKIGHLNYEYDKAYALSDIVLAATKVYEVTKDTLFLNYACRVADTIPPRYEYFRKSAWQAIAQSAANAYKIKKDSVLLNHAHRIARIPESDSERDMILAAIVEILAKAYLTTQDVCFLEQSCHLTDEITQDYNYRVAALDAIICSMAKMGKWREAREMAELATYDRGKVLTLGTILKIWSERKYHILTGTEGS